MTSKLTQEDIDAMDKWCDQWVSYLIEEGVQSERTTWTEAQVAERKALTAFRKLIHQAKQSIRMDKGKNRWALVSTVGNNLGENFPHQQVLTFENEKEAIWYAANLLCEHDEGVTREGNGIYRYKGQHWTAAQLIVEWRETNLDTELFHIWEVVEVSTGDVVDALVSEKGSGH